MVYKMLCCNGSNYQEIRSTNCLLARMHAGPLLYATLVVVGDMSLMRNYFFRTSSFVHLWCHSSDPRRKRVATKVVVFGGSICNQMKRLFSFLTDHCPNLPSYFSGASCKMCIHLSDICKPCDGHGAYFTVGQEVAIIFWINFQFQINNYYV